MKTGICPKCGSAHVFMKQNGIKLGEHSGGVYVYTSMMTKISSVDCYICTDCGYFEHYLADAAKLVEVANKWQKVNP